MKSNKISLLLIGFLSGIINILILSILGIESDLGEIFYAWLAGLPYGIITGIYFKKAFSLNKKLFILWIASSALSYYAAFKAFLMTSAYYDLISINSFSFAGLFGSLVLILAFNFFIHKINLIQLLTTVSVGTIIPFLICSLFDINHIDYISINGQTSLYYLLCLNYIIWQTTITYLLGRKFLINENIAKTFALE